MFVILGSYLLLLYEDGGLIILPAADFPDAMLGHPVDHGGEKPKAAGVIEPKQGGNFLSLISEVIDPTCKTSWNELLVEYATAYFHDKNFKLDLRNEEPGTKWFDLVKLVNALDRGTQSSFWYDQLRSLGAVSRSMGLARYTRRPPL